MALQAVFAEWLTLNAPYAIFLARFGVGPGSSPSTLCSSCCEWCWL
uniref:Uncharacterized protein n=1 Tax=Phenylobacterium glaciei TaxID=2803784 RepID=A0A974P5P7_9CAUL|nr:hypothetical protein JKL49_11500 [Phenylobacterium glaciei]